MIPVIQVTPANEEEEKGGPGVSRGKGLGAAAVQRGDGVICNRAQDDAFTTETFNDFIDQLVAYFRASPEPDVCFVMDNCRIHDHEGLP